MCFSATVSFGASLFIGATGIAALKKAKTPVQRTFGMIPIFFAIQQFSEGIVWLALSDAMNGAFRSLMPEVSYMFLIFAWIIWPIFIPLSMSLLEPNLRRKKILQLLTGIGAGVVLILVYMMFNYNVNVSMNDYHIKYSLAFSHPQKWILGLFYVLPVVFSSFISSIKKMWYLGAINLGSYIMTKILFAGFVISTWCFFAAISSIFVYVIIKELQSDSDSSTKSSPIISK